MTAPLRTPLATLFAGGGTSPVSLATALGVDALLYGARSITEHDASPRAVVVAAGGAFEAPVQRAPGTQRAVATAWSEWDVHLWATDLDAAREMERALAAWLVENWPAAHRLQRSTAPPNTVVQDGDVIVVRISLRETLVAAPRTTVVVTATATDATTAAPGDGALTAGET